MKCECGQEMKCLGNVSGLVMTSNPVQWTATYVCDTCKIRKDIRMHGVAIPPAPDLSGYRNI